MKKQNRYLKEYLREKPDALVEKFQYGMTFFDSNDLTKAFDIFNSILEKEPMHPPAMFYSSAILLRQGDIKEATAKLENIILNVEKENLFYNRAQEQLVKLYPERAAEFAVKDGQDVKKTDKVLLN